MYISKETPEQTEKRLLSVLAQAACKVFDGSYTFVEFPLNGLNGNAKDTALALVRDEEVWSQLIPSQDASKEVFKIIRFHFPPGLDNSGFVGWQPI